MLTKKDLKDYPNLIAEIDDLTRRINKSLKEIVTDVVSSSSPDFPYTAHSTSIHGVSPNQSLIERRHKLQDKLRQKTEEIELFIDTLPTSKERNIVRMRVLDGMSWGQIAAKMGYAVTKESVRKTYNRALGRRKIK